MVIHKNQKTSGKFHEKSCGVVLFTRLEGETSFLLLHYPQGHWDLPKGHVEKDETEEETALRELAEETGIIDAEIISGFREEISYFYRLRGKISHKQVVFFLAKTSAPEVLLSHEHMDFCWLPYKSALEKLTFENTRKILRKSWAHIKKD